MDECKIDDCKYLYPDEMGYWDHCMDASESIDDVLWKILTLSFSNQAHEERVLEWINRRSIAYEAWVKNIFDGDETIMDRIFEEAKAEADVSLAATKQSAAKSSKKKRKRA